CHRRPACRHHHLRVLLYRMDCALPWDHLQLVTSSSLTHSLASSAPAPLLALPLSPTLYPPLNPSLASSLSPSPCHSYRFSRFLSPCSFLLLPTHTCHTAFSPAYSRAPVQSCSHASPCMHLAVRHTACRFGFG
ncbi:unnamed protein product, partial [Closterium sp. NIES-54]